MAAGPIPTRLDLQSKWENDIPLKFLWTIALTPRTGAGSGSGSLDSIASNVTSILQKHEGTRKWPVKGEVYKAQSSSDYGYMFAYSVAFPNDAFNITNSSVEGAGGFLPGYIGSERAGYGGANSVNITFMETNADIIDNIIRPWIIAS